MTDELRQMQIQQLELMQGTERLISTCSKRTDTDFPDAPMNADGTRLFELNWELIDVSIEFGTALFAASEAGLLTPEEYRELGDQFYKALKLCVRASTVILAPGHAGASQGINVLGAPR
jgi:hypothetical protein